MSLSSGYIFGIFPVEAQDAMEIEDDLYTKDGQELTPSCMQALRQVKLKKNLGSQI